MSESSSHSIEETQQQQQQQQAFQRQYFYNSSHRSNSVPSNHNGQDRSLQVSNKDLINIYTRKNLG